MESQPQNPEVRFNPENFHPYISTDGLTIDPGFILLLKTL